VTGFDKERYMLDKVELVWPSDEQVCQIAELLSAQDPWKKLGMTAAALECGFSKSKQMNMAWAVVVDGESVGMVTIKPDWLLGPYLNLIGLVDWTQGTGIGLKVLQWMEAEARDANARNLYLCVSDFNTRAQSFYETFGFERVGILEDLLLEGYSEILMRKRLF